ncbi:MAG: chemotaxis response regulator protein-glutamate methylesterase [Spirochaetales bacterium]|nr:chemotaxis response regulator protein-glutamate methylesterase [Spirochaetales bacterium]
MSARISVLIVDDSSIMRKMIRTIFEKTPDITVAATAMNGEFALYKMKTLKPDVIILDIQMPQMDGIAFLREKKSLHNSTPVIILSSIARRGAHETMEALALGASDFLLKPSSENDYNVQQVADQLIQLVRAYSGKKSFHETDTALRYKKYECLEYKTPQKYALKKMIVPKRQPGKIEVVAIGISTGGPSALRDMCSKLKDTLSVPVLIVQHMPPGFTEEFAYSLNKICALEVKEAHNGDIIKKGRVLLAPGTAHMEVVSKPLAKVIQLKDSEPVNGHKPSVGVLFSSIAAQYANRSLAIIMTGMGKDGAKEIGSVYIEGGFTIAQDAASSVVFGMPKVAIENGFIHKVACLEEIPKIINSLERGPILNH